MTSKKEKFIEVVDSLFRVRDMVEYCNGDKEFANDVLTYFDELKSEEKTNILTEDGRLIIECMNKNIEKYNNCFKARDIGEEIFKSARSVSGSMKKLCTDGYCLKIGDNPAVYSLTDAGKEIINN